MAAYNGRRAPNVSQYLANLNTIPTAQELAAQNELNLGDDGLDFLTNTQFFDFDEFHQTGDHDQSSAPHSAHSTHNGQPYQFSEFQTFASPSSPQSTIGANGLPYPGAAAGQHQFPATGDKRKASIALPSTGGADLEEASRYAAEEDKRRRNTAASARFRVKKKQREQALEKQAKDMTDRVSQLEGKIQQLEMENKWLKELITEKSDVKTVDASLASKKLAESEERKPEKRSDGVGTVEDGDAVKDED